MFWIPIRSISDAALNESQRIAGFPVDSVSPIIDAGRIVAPVMIVLGESDEKISPRYGYAVYEQLRSPDKVWYPIPGGMHDNLPSAGGPGYRKAIIGFFTKHLSR